MKIDFHTQYNEREFKGLCQEALNRGLNALVMTGLGENRQVQYKTLTVFPVQELNWTAALEVNSYKSMKDWEEGKKDSTPTKIYRGKLLALLPQSNTFLADPDKRLYELLEQVKANNGIAIALQDDSNWPITLSMVDRKKTYPFDAIRIRPYNSHDVNSELESAPVSVAGSEAYCARDLCNGKGFTVYENPTLTQEELIDALRKRTKNKLFVHNNGNPVRIEDTVKPLTISTESFFKRLF